MSLPFKFMKKSERERYSRIIDQDNKAVARIERALEKALRKQDNKSVRAFEKIANREMGIYDKDTKRDYW